MVDTMETLFESICNEVEALAAIYPESI